MNIDELPEEWAFSEEVPFRNDALKTNEIIIFLEGNSEPKYPDLSYFPKWRKRLESQGFYCGFSWVALLFSIHWCMYRKLYPAGVLLYLCSYLVSFIIVLVTGNQSVGIVGSLIVLFAFAFFANQLLFNRMIKVVLSGRESGGEKDAADFIAGKGGNSVIGLILSLLFSTGVAIMSFAANF